METQLKFIFEQIGSVPPTVDNFFFEWIALAIRTDNNFLKRISQAIRGDDNFFNRQPKPFKQMTIFFGTDRTSCSNGRQFFPNRQPKPFKWMKIFLERIPRAIQTDTKSVQKWQNIFHAQSAGDQGHPMSIFQKYLFGRRFEIQNFRNICCKISCLPTSPGIFKHLKSGIHAHYFFNGFLP